MTNQVRGVVLVGLFAAGMLSVGCSTEGTAIPIGDSSRVFPATDPAMVSLLVEPPSRPHEIIALVEGVAATDDYFSETRTQAAALDAMKKQAAKLGSHAIVLTGKGREPYGQVTIANTTATASGAAVGNTALMSGFATTTGSTVGWEKIRFAGTAIRYKDEGAK